MQYPSSKFFLPLFQNANLGLERGTVAFQKYNRLWAEAFDALKDNLKPFLFKNSLEIEHVGSTAIPNSYAKPILDILMLFKDIHTFQNDLLPLLEQYGFTYKGEYNIPGRFLFNYYNDDNTIDYAHIHAFISGHEHHYRLLSFRDHLRQNGSDLNEYNNLKINLKKQNISRKDYPYAKDNFASKILKQQAKNLLNMHRGNVKLLLATTEDRELLFHAISANRNKLEPWLSWVSTTRTVKDTEKFLEGAWLQFLGNRGWHAKIFVLDEFAGMISLHDVDWTSLEASVGYWLCEKFQGQRIATTAVEILAQHVFNIWQLKKLRIVCAYNNIKSQNVAKSSGFIKQVDIHAGSRVCASNTNNVVFSMLRNHYLANQ